jgi:uncharacterized protein
MSLAAQPFDAFRAAERREVRTGAVDARELPRVNDRLADEEDTPHRDATAEVAWSIVGGKSVDGRAALKLALTGSLPLICQRCLQPMNWPLDHDSEVLLARDEGELAALDEASEQEVLLVVGPVDPHSLVEDELVLTIPFVPRHDGDCLPPVDE